MSLDETAAVTGGAPTSRPRRAGHELARGTIVGRYMVLSKLGSGGMGVVYAAYDPELGRKVALKLLRAELGDESGPQADARMRMMREAQALAKLDHPNVITIHDVGVVDDSLWLAMGIVEGETLGAWCQQDRGWRAVIEVLEQAGSGLEAAHRAGLVHRDFKPENVMVGGDGRVSVMDLGLARWAGESRQDALDLGGLKDADTDVRPELAVLSLRVTQDGAVIGTPYYMAPEQFAGQDVDVAADIFAFCVTAWEALYGERPFAGTTLVELAANVLGTKVRAPPKRRAPKWVRRILERGLLRDPAARWPTMSALLAALRRGPLRARRLWLAAGLAVVGLGVGGALLRGGEATMCQGAADELAGVWNGARRAAIERAILATGVEYAEAAAATTIATLDRHAVGWIAANTLACESHQRGQISPQLLDRRMTCLARRRVELDALAAILAQTSRTTAAQTVDAAAGLPAVALCEDDARLLADVAPPEDPAIVAAVEAARVRMARLRALELSGQFDAALRDVPALLGEAERLGYAPLQAEVHLATGRVHMSKFQSLDARIHLAAAARLGIETHADAVAAEALASRIYILTFDGDFREALELAPLARAHVKRVGDPPLLTAQWHICVGVAHSVAGDAAAALAEGERALEILIEHAPDDPLRWAAVNNVSLYLSNLGRYQRAEELAGDALLRLERKYGACHPHTSSLRATLASAEAALGRVDPAIARFQRSFECSTGEYPAIASSVLQELTWISFLRGDLVQAREHLARANELRGAAGPSYYDADLDLLGVEVEIQSGRLDEARRLLVAMRARAGEALSEVQQFSIDVRLGLVAHLGHEDREALEHLGRAGQRLPAVQRAADRGLHDFTLARVLRALGREPERARAAGEQALAEYASSGALYAGRVAEVQAWLAAGSRVSARALPGRR